MKTHLVKVAVLGIMTYSVLVAGPASATSTTYYGWQQWAGPGANGHWYEVVDTHNYTTWQMAYDQATSLGGYLVTLTSAEENAFVYEGLRLYDKGAQGFYLGGYQPDYIATPQAETDPAAGWAWVTGEQWAYTNWNPAGNPNVNYGPEPNNCGLGCVAQNYLHYFPAYTVNDSHWDDIEERRGDMYGFVMERDSTPIPEPASLVLLGSGLIGVVCLRYRRDGR